MPVYPNARSGPDEPQEIDLPVDEESSTSFVSGEQDTQDSAGCSVPLRMTKVIDEKLHGKIVGGHDMTMIDYFPDLITKGYLHDVRNAGLFNTGKHVGANVQLYGTVPSVCRPELFSLAQTVTHTVNRKNGVPTPLEGTTRDDLKDSGRDASKAPFRQDWLGDDGYNISMADTPSYAERLPFSSSTNVEWVKDYVTSLIGPGGQSSVHWTFVLKIVNGRVVDHDVT
jgi:hypothetical protein